VSASRTSSRPSGGDGSAAGPPPIPVPHRAPSSVPDGDLDFDKVYARHFGFVWRSLRALGMREDDAEDAAQDVFLVVHRRLGEFEGRAKITTWLYAICRRVASDYYRRRNKAAIPSHQEADALPDRRGASPLVTVESARAAQALEHFLTTLDPDQRDVFFLMCIEELSAPEAAEMLQTKLNTVYSRLRLARQKFERYVARIHGEPVP
jgi:RNA polymerase sigma-70 factor, ECF subfamily